MRALIVDDEQEARDTLLSAIEECCPQISVVELAQNGQEALEKIRTKDPELVFLDIDLGDMSGFDMLEQLESKPDFHIIFITGYNTFACRAFELSAVDYLLKPFTLARLTAAVAKLEDKLLAKSLHTRIDALQELIREKDKPNPTNRRWVINTQDHVHIIALKDLIYIQAYSPGTYCRVYVQTNHQPIILSKSLTECEDLFKDSPFLMRIHRSHMVNLHMVRRVNKKDRSVVLQNNHPGDLVELKVAESYLTELENRLFSLR